MGIKRKKQNGPAEYELFETLEEIVDDPDYFYENPEEELERNLRLGFLLKTKNILIIVLFFFIVIFCVGAWRTLTYGKTQTGYVIATEERVEFLDYMVTTGEWQTEIILFEENISSLNKQSTYDNGVLTRKPEILDSNILVYQERIDWLTEFNSNDYMSKKRNENLKLYNELLIDMYSKMITICKNEKYYGIAGFDDYNEEAYGSIKDNYLTYQTDLILGEYNEQIKELNGYRVKLETLTN